MGHVRATRRITAGLAALTALVALPACSDGSDGKDAKAGVDAPPKPAAVAPVGSGTTYVALGDSYAAGVMIPTIVPAAPKGCSRSESNYAHLVAKQKQITDL